jgi:biopolymer transport protein ExbD
MAATGSFACVLLGCNFVITSAFIVRTNLILRQQCHQTVRLPVATDRRSIDGDNQTYTVFVADDGHLEVTGQPIDVTRLRVLIGERHETRVRILASRGARYDDLKKLIATLAAAGVSRGIFSTLNSKPEAPPRTISQRKRGGAIRIRAAGSRGFAESGEALSS